MSARLLSVNVGLPREVEWNGTTVRSAIWKEPVTGARMVRRINVDGDDQADRGGHGGEHRAVFVYQIDSYRYWQEQLGRDDFTYGQFGENFTVEGLADDEVCIGDRYRIGGAVFEVTQPRVTCFRVAIRMDEPTMPSLLVAHHRPGFYFRVHRGGSRRGRRRDREGRVRAGGAHGRRGRRAPLPARPHARRPSRGRCGCPPSARVGRARFASCSRAPMHEAPPSRRGPAFDRCAWPPITPESRDVTSFRLVPEDEATPPAGEPRSPVST